MSDIVINDLKQALENERKARIAAEKKLVDHLDKSENIIKDLNEKAQQLEEKLLKKDSELKGIFENINDAFVLIDLRGNVVKMNDIAVTMFGYDYEENKPLNLMKVVHPDDYGYTIEAFKNLIEEGFYTKYRSRIITKDKTIKTLEVNCSLVYDPEGEIVGAQGIARDITEQIEIQELLQAQRDQLDIIFNNSPIGIVLSEQQDEEFLFVNTTIKEMLGYTVPEMKALTIGGFTHPDDREESKKMRDKVASGELDNFIQEKRYIKKNGDILWAKTIVNSVKNQDSKVKFQVATIEDITENKLAEQRLIESENRLSSLVSNLDSAVLLENEQREIVISNKKFCDIFSIPKKATDLVGLNCVQMLGETKDIFENPDYFVNRINKLIKDKKVVLGDELRLVDGRILERDYIPISKNNEYKGHLWTYRDVTLSRNYRKSLEAHKKRYSNIIANLKLGLVELDRNNKVLSANNNFVKMTGFDEEKILDKNIRELFKKEEIIDFIQDRNKDKKGKRKSRSYEFKFINNLGVEKVLLVSAAPSFDIQGDITGSIGIVLDITNIKKLESQKEQLLKQLEQRNVELEEYAHIVSHDLKSPLRSISALTSWLKEDHGGVLGEDGVRNVDMIQEVVEKMERLINDILNYSSINNDGEPTEEVDTYKVMEGISKLIYVPKHIKIEIDKNLPKIKADKVRIQQLFQNLMSNAVNYIDKEEGLITIGVKEKKKSYIFSVQDNGIGIKPEYHAKIFEVFQSLGNHKDSTGIGLSIVKKIVDVYGGKIWLESIEGMGTTFFIEFNK
ncbi:PAS domain-containing sensor histidine kinase [uncultured Tenacibaculum sp.]|uniref:PAS domain-containing sensor histidine kinase n=1 Tax=uncultured Tenacibaculum sp. TaxID=174713 RepID=UPI00261B6A25|nr:PAS domain-containing sensor histidine kinase [uncultured Tenacibaculum sp.]